MKRSVESSNIYSSSNKDILEYVFSIVNISKEQKLLHIYHKIKELCYVRGIKETLTERNKISFAEYGDLIERMRHFYDENKKCLLLCNMQTISYHLFKYFDNCFNYVFIEEGVSFPVFKLNIKKFLNLEIYRYCTCQQIRFFIFLYLEKFLYSFPIFSYKNKINRIVSEGVFLFNFDHISRKELDDVSFYLLIEDVNYIISIIAPIYFHSIIFFKSENFKEKFYKIFKLFQNKYSRNIFIEKEEELKTVVKKESMYTQHQMGRPKVGAGGSDAVNDEDNSNIFCDYSEFFLLKSLFQTNHRNEKIYKENLIGRKPMDPNVNDPYHNENMFSHKQNEKNLESLQFDDIFILEHLNYMKLQKIIQNKIAKEKELRERNKKEEKKLQLTTNMRDNWSEKKRMEFVEKEMWSNMFDLNYFRKSATEYKYNLLTEKETERQFIDFVTKTNNYKTITNNKGKDTCVGNVILLNKKKKKEKDKSKRIYVDFKKTNCDVSVCLYKNNLNYISKLDNLLRESMHVNRYVKQPEVIGADFTYSELPYENFPEGHHNTRIEVNRQSLQLRGFR